MKRRYILGLLLIIGGYFIIDNLLVNNKENDSVETDVTYVKHENALSMMLETESGSGEYTLETRSSWPTQDDGYIFNSTLSKCENGSKLSWDNDNNAVIMTGNVSDKCYVYFDKKIKYSINYSNMGGLGVEGQSSAYFGDIVQVHFYNTWYDCRKYPIITIDNSIVDMTCSNKLLSSNEYVFDLLTDEYCVFTMPEKNINFNFSYEGHVCVS